MTSWTSISNAAVAVGGIPASSTVTALRDNPAALAEGASGAPVMVSGWHPVDKVTIGDGKTGRIYDFATNGVVASVVTPDFEDGYEYRVLALSLSHNSGTSQTLRLEVLYETETVYWTAVTLASMSGSATASLDAEILMPRLAKPDHFMRYVARTGTASLDATTAALSQNEDAQKILRARLIFSAGSIDAGQVYLFRRREYASSP